jgi:hypothetical protein
MFCYLNRNVGAMANWKGASWNGRVGGGFGTYLYVYMYVFSFVHL